MIIFALPPTTRQALTKRSREASVRAFATRGGGGPLSLAPTLIMRERALRALRLGLVVLLAAGSASFPSEAADDSSSTSSPSPSPSPSSPSSSSGSAPAACTLDLPPGACAVVTTGSAPMSFTVRPSSSDLLPGQKACAQESIE